MTEGSGLVALVEDDADMLHATTQLLELAGFGVIAFKAAEAALAAVDRDFQGVVVSDIRMPGMNGLQLFDRIRAIDIDIPVILVTGHGDVDLAVAALKDGVYDFIPKPYAGERLVEALNRAGEKRRLVMENRRLHEAAAQAADGLPLIGEAPAIRRLRETLRQIADMDVDVLVEGETGTGKEVVADLLHRWGRRRAKPFVALNCGALPETVIESELFGHEPGAFTGAQRRRIGRIEHSSGGTLFLDEIESMPPPLQVKLLRVLETRSLTPLGSNETRRLDLRVVAATKVDLGRPDQRGDFREDLYFRLNVVTLRIPPLRERRGDIPMLFGHFLGNASQRFGRPVAAVNAAVSDHLQSHDWPGNVRELAHFADRVALGLGPDEEARATSARLPEPSAALPERVGRYEAQLIREALRDHAGDVRGAIDALGVPRKTFYDKLKRYGISASEFRNGGTPDRHPVRGRT
ncbi:MULTISPECIES: sigma-54-dependent transcriptional regulator [unclassified Mesorhizobium]|uniref:sigma-54-dependent transcriptional regulator n=1 Tax=unclassified Mesorhizobium TaxID=325217 RepID=UPI001126CD98|nr:MULTISPECIES: sigma-54 dependent transcriptional regulator [unclassified Mesorhizobium]TPJ41277.1 sigma-54-dependent Fis family transcriptional regulator [Mesorhizobium sp. B2-6-6]MBZ9703401.1 sigma-54 dependent transcriptional regulator [Mesorhizobium sp. CO1-1-3]MBZ9948387.1 sigma-54 dependent transcriptional regulator [Mesorhizobium sp. BR1-1-11]MCA0003956.1 sigma-54 dependent transcriptional regulator [Mesorhizobium sp. B264B2A]MCA0008202.1 sigma-54 dependent transcriptional regulator [